MDSSKYVLYFGCGIKYTFGKGAKWDDFNSLFPREGNGGHHQMSSYLLSFEVRVYGCVVNDKLVLSCPRVCHPTSLFLADDSFKEALSLSVDLLYFHNTLARSCNLR